MDGFFPLSAKATTVKGLLISVVCYILLTIATGFILGFLTGMPLVGTVISFISNLIDLYCWGGIVVSIMKYFKVV